MKKAELKNRINRLECDASKLRDDRQRLIEAILKRLVFDNFGLDATTNYYFEEVKVGNSLTLISSPNKSHEYKTREIVLMDNNIRFEDIYFKIGVDRDAKLVIYKFSLPIEQ